MAIAVIIIIGIVVYPIYERNRKQVEVINVVNATADLIKNIDSYHNLIKQNEPAQTSTNSNSFDIMSFLGNGGDLNPDLWQLNTNWSSSTSDISSSTGTAFYTVKGTQWMMEAFAFQGSYDASSNTQIEPTYEVSYINQTTGSDDVSECVMLVNQIFPFFADGGGTIQVNGTTVYASGVWQYAYPGLQNSPDMDSVTSACSTNNGTGTIGLQINASKSNI